MLRVVRRSAVKARTQAANQLHALVVTAPEPLKHRLRGLSTRAQIEVCARFRPATAQTTAAYTKRALRHLARRYQNLDTEITQVDKQIRGLCHGPTLRCWPPTKLGPDTAVALLTAAGDNPGRMNTNTAFAALYGASPVPASSGRTVRHRLNRGGNRQANNALWRVATNRMRHDPPTKEYVTRRQAEGNNGRPEILRCLKRHIASRRSTTSSPTRPQHLDGAQLRNVASKTRITLTHAADRLDTQPSRPIPTPSEASPTQPRPRYPIPAIGSTPSNRFVKRVGASWLWERLARVVGRGSCYEGRRRRK